MAKRELSAVAFNSVKEAAKTDFKKQITMIDFNLLKPNAQNFYSMDSDRIELLAEDIERQGLKQNLVVTKKGADGFYTIISGHRRYAAITLLRNKGREFSLMPCLIEGEKPDDELEYDLIMGNATQRVKRTGCEI